MLKIICDIVGIAGFVLSVVNIFLTFLRNRRRLNVRFGADGITSLSDQDLFAVAFSFENLSQLPISITRVQLQVAGKLYDCDRVPHVVERVRIKSKDFEDTSVLKSVSVPVNLPSLGAESGFLVFGVPQGTLSSSEKDLIFQICTNRGKAVQRTFARYEDVLIR